jgi:type IV pilus assembly protein PilO
MADNRLTKLPILAQLGIAVGLALAILGGFYYLWYSDALANQKKKEGRLAELRQQIRALEATANKLAEFKREVQTLEARLEVLKRILPPEKEMPDLMKRVQYLASQSSLRVAGFKPSAARQTEFYQEVPIALELEGTFHNFGFFLDRISRMSRLVNVGDLKIRAQGQPTINSTIAITATATTYVYSDAPAAAARGTKRGAR